MLNKEFVETKIEYIQRDLVRLEPLGNLIIDEVAHDFMKYAALKNFLMEIIGRAVDINQHIIAECGDPKIESPLRYKETFLYLAKIDVLPKDFGKEISASAGFRNAIVHDYNDLDKYIIFKTVGEAIKQYTQYCGYILKFLEKQKQ